MLTGCGADNIIISQAVEVPDTCEKTTIPYGAPSVKIKFSVSESGKINNQTVSQTSGYKNIDDAALKNIETCMYLPLIINEKTQLSWVERTYTWTQNIANK